MVKKEKRALKVVLDTNVLVSALLFKGNLSPLVDLWKKGNIIPLVTTETFQELRDVLVYAKFRLTSREIRSIIEDEVLPFCEVVESTEHIHGVCKDPDDDKFLSCAVSGSAEYLLTGDRRLLDLKKYRSVRIESPSDFINRIKS